MIKTILFTAAAITAVAISAPAAASQCDRLNGQSRAKCLDGERQAARYVREARNYERLARVRDTLCVVDTVGQRAGRTTLHGRAYSAGRAVGNAVSGGASSCRR